MYRAALLALLLCACPQFVTEPDAGEPLEDAGLAPDSGEVPLEDAGPDEDAGQASGDAGEVADAGRDAGLPTEDAGLTQDAGEPPPIACQASEDVLRASEPAIVTCLGPGGARITGWSVEPDLGAQVTDLGGGQARFHLPSSAIAPSFGDTTFRIVAAFELASGGSASGLAEITVLGNLWVGRGDGNAVDAFASDGVRVGTAVGPGSLDNRPRALALRADGAVLVAQKPVVYGTSDPAAPVVVVSREGARLGELEGTDLGGQPLFAGTVLPRSILQARDGTIWVTGARAPVIYDARGFFLRRGAEAPDELVGIAQLDDGRIAVTFSSRAIGFYSADGATFESTPLVLEPYYNFSELSALALEPDGSLLVSCSHYVTGVQGTGTILRLRPDLALDGELAENLRVYQDLPSHVLPFAGEVVVTQKISHPVGQCPARYDAALATKLGCLGDGTGMPQYRGIVQLAAAP